MYWKAVCRRTPCLPDDPAGILCYALDEVFYAHFPDSFCNSFLAHFDFEFGGSLPSGNQPTTATTTGIPHAAFAHAHPGADIDGYGRSPH
ncbi:MAG: hypothetical protein ACE5FD_13140 [Anaerolineae bacterium]